MKTITWLNLSALLAMLAGAGSAAAQAESLIAAEPPRPAFICPDGERLEIDHEPGVGVLKLRVGGQDLVLQQQVGTPEPRFVAGADTVSLFDGEIRVRRAGRPLATCPQLPSTPVAGQIWGTLLKLDRMALPPGTRAKVMLVDAARADAPAIEVASTTLVTTGNQVPLHFLLRYDPARVTPRGLTWRLMARFEDEKGRLRYITDTAVFVLETSPAQPPMELKLVPVAPQG